MQTLESDLMQEFEKELEELEKVKSSHFVTGASKSEALSKFWDKFLNTTFPKGSINKKLEKNFAVWICQNKIDVSAVVQKYKSQKWNPAGLKGWIKKCLNGEIVSVNVLELLQWSNDNNHFEVELLEQAKSELNTPPKLSYNLLSDVQLKDYQPKNEGFIVQKLIGHGKIIGLAGKRASLKSWLSLNLSYSIVHGLDFLGKFPTKKTNVLYFDRENGFSEMKIRSSMIKNGLGCSDSENLYFLSESYLKFDNSENLRVIEGIIKEFSIGLIVVDTYRRAISFDENDATKTSQLFVDYLKPLCERTGVSVLLIHHEKKSNGTEGSDKMDLLRGSSDFANYLDGIVQLTRKGNSITFEQTKNRQGREISPFLLEIQTDENSFFKFKYLGEAVGLSDALAQILTDWFISDNIREFRYSEALKFADSKGFSKNKFIHTLKILEEQGIVLSQGFKRPYLVKVYGQEVLK